MRPLATTLAALEQAVIAQFRLELDGMYGQSHWRRVLRNGALIAEADPRVDSVVVAAFAFLHDAARATEARDLEHGPAASALALRLACVDLFKGWSKSQLTLLRAACCDHPLALPLEMDAHRDAPTLNACWDAAKLDLPRMGVTPTGLRSLYALQPGVIERHVEEAWNPDDPAAMIGGV